MITNFLIINVIDTESYKMAIGKKTGGRNFVPGVVTNPKGRARIPEDLKAIRKLTKPLVEYFINKVALASKEELDEIAKDPLTPALERLMASIMLKGIFEGSPLHASFIMNRTIGTVVEKTQVSLPERTVIKHFGEDAVTVLGSKREDDEE